MPNEFIARNGIISKGNVVVSGSVVSTAPASFSGSLAVTGSLIASSAVISGDVQVLGTASISNLVVNQIGYSSGSNQLGDAVNDTQTLYGSVIIPTGSLTVTGSISSTDYIRPQYIASSASVVVMKNIGGSQYVTDLSTGGTGDLRFYYGSGGGWSFNWYTDNTHRVRISDGGMGIGIGNINPSARLHVKGSGATSSTTALLVQNANASSSLAVLDNGYVSINTGSAAYHLDVNGTARINSSLYITDPSYAGSGRLFQSGNSTLVLTGGPGGGNENITFGPTNRIFINAGQVRFPNGSVQIASTLTLGSTNATSTNMLLMQGSITAGSALARGIGMDTALVAAANNDVLVGLDVNPTYTNGAYTGVSNIALRITGSSSSTLLEIDSPASNNILFVSGSGNVGIGTGTPTSTLHIKGVNAVYASSSLKVENSTTSGSFKVTNTGKLFLAVSNTEGYSEPQTVNSASMYIYEGPGNSGRAGITIHSGQSGNNGSYLHLFNYISHWASGIQHYSSGGGAIQKMRFYIGYDASQQLGDGGNVMTLSSNGLGINTLAAEISANLQIKGSGTTSSTTALLVQNANASSSLQVKDDGTTSVLSSNENSFTVSHTNGSSKLAFVLGNGSAISAGFAALRLNDSVNVFTFGGSRTITAYPLTVGTPTDTFYIRGGGGGSDVANPAVALTDNTYNAGGYTVTSGTQTTVQIGGIGAPSNSIWKPASGTANYTLLAVAPNMSGSGTYSGTIRGIYYNPTVNSTTYGAHRAIETTAGDVVFGGNTRVAVTGSLSITGSAGSGSALYAYKSGSTVLDIQGSQGQLFSVVDALSGSLMSVNDVSGLPILEVFSDDRVVMGTYGAPGLTVSGSSATVATGSSAPTGTAPEGTFRFVASGGSYFIYAYVGGAWRSGSLF